jgi:hypothetical protein
MQAIDRIVFTGDVLRPFPTAGGGWESATRKNVRWLRHLLGWSIGRATGLPSRAVAWEPEGFDAGPVYAALGLPVAAESWASIFYDDSLPEAAAGALAAPYAGALVIGVEIPDCLQAVLSRRGIPFVDVVAHPVRFMDDLLFAFRTNHRGVHARLLAHRFDLDRCVPYANLLRAKAAWMPPLDLPHGTALLTGQVATDKALICRERGRFLSLADFTDRLFDLCDRHPLVLFKPHPYQDGRCPSRRVVEAFGAIRTVNENFYHLVSQEGVTDVYAISSGTVWEAPYFERAGRAFAPALYDFGDRAPECAGAGGCVPVGGEFLSPAFWSDVLSPLTPTRADVPPGPPARPSRLRRSLNADWDHGWMDVVVQRGGAAPPAPSPRARRVPVPAAAR